MSYPKQVECPSCWHVFDPAGKAVGAYHPTEPRTDVCAGHDCVNEFTTTHPAKRFCSRGCQLRARRH